MNWAMSDPPTLARVTHLWRHRTQLRHSRRRHESQTQDLTPTWPPVAVAAPGTTLEVYYKGEDTEQTLH